MHTQWSGSQIAWWRWTAGRPAVRACVPLNAAAAAAGVAGCTYAAAQAWLPVVPRRDKYRLLEKFEVAVPDDQLNDLGRLDASWATYTQVSVGLAAVPVNRRVWLLVRA